MRILENAHLRKVVRKVGLRSLLMVVAVTLYVASETVDLVLVSEEAPALEGTFIVGDSTTWRLTGEYDNTFNLWAARHPDWTVDGVGGRNVTRLDDRIRYHLENVDSSPAVFVMALGTNPDRDDLWGKADYLDALSLLPASTKVVLVTPVRASRGTARRRAIFAQVRRYATYLRQIAATRPGTQIAEWQALVLKDPERDPVTGVGHWTFDGTHQRRVAARSTWMDLLDAAILRLSS